ncbi:MULTISPECIES: MerR family transcriptional regulator [unclassified Actinopolyspora]|uniref:MerR family transcriptional regulator n=1 Tax=unclassified Actinopolyspora TaxID=2639451 RepID=UPI0013F65455|nr:MULTISPECIES: MerR family transcriptional regulator [unclassified Actinopolyspora]NHD18853.1 MerR family transcriptional regulator [Actinopolyspora sp. BKK2]NHE77276.1 MerR family transcriptional regulator [Actinopolyspora sp. BKK1]
MAAEKARSSTLGIGEVAERTGLSVYTLRFYERRGLLLSPVHRTSGGRRRYHQEDVDWLRICTRLRSSGMSLERLREFTELVRQGPGNEQQRLALLHEHREHVRARITELRECLDLITWKTDIYEQHVNRGTARGVWDPIAESSPPGDGTGDSG